MTSRIYKVWKAPALFRSFVWERYELNKVAKNNELNKVAEIKNEYVTQFRLQLSPANQGLI